ncbi:hypothetical protein [Rhizobium sp. Leaf384]|uniref:hypothetical protein n=1 Tax=Rhizobium sp. Leaf384 TaxID=1736358 RepID=UPI000A6C0FF0|nr:hypothetical protein [Rhizobium sp. Leaf384]
MHRSTERMPWTTRVIGKVAAVTVAIWIMKILATTLGETTGDFLSMTPDLAYYVGFAITFFALAVILFFQIRAPRYNRALFWLAIVATTAAGTEISDMLDRSFGLGYASGSALLVAGLMASLASGMPAPVTSPSTPPYAATWRSRSGSRSSSPTVSVMRSAISLTDNMDLSYLQGALVTAAIIGAVVVCLHTTRLNHILLFWIAFVFTRPFGATFGDLLTKPLEKGGMDLPAVRRRW